MKIYISEEAIVADIEDRFHSLYPNLKLEFFRKPHEEGKCSPANEKLPSNAPIEKIRMMHSFGWMDVSYYRTAAAVEHDFSHLFGLHAQILRKAGRLWLITTGTDNRTLEELNATGFPDEKQEFRLPEETEE
ncbi:MAG TPA: hypothetical protein VM802_03190 [Chitinophaga sp.]|uniref:hypothetical protein n=1 Tax=Chitinophaga sp. TaxID=1869181 RepID=UPI002CD84A4D|nr:hypothetical protein [Chitinophaga sp.]HVI43840.1 hypothetical protein [Chitinophaga sp.]